MRILLDYYQAKGDCLASTAAVRALHSANWEWQIYGSGPHTKDIFCDCPFVSTQNCLLPDLKITMRHDPFSTSHYCLNYFRVIEEATGLTLDKTDIKPSLWFSYDNGPPPQPFWLLNAGYKRDNTLKAWNGYQDVVNHFAGRITFLQVGSKRHFHRPIEGAVNLIGQTTVRELILAARGASGVLGGESFLRHVGIALGKPVVTLASGRMPASYLRYPGEHYLSSYGQLDCCKEKGCMLSRVKPLGDGSERDKLLCAKPDGDYASCMTMIDVNQVIERIDACLQDER